MWHSVHGESKNELRVVVVAMSVAAWGRVGAAAVGLFQGWLLAAANGMVTPPKTATSMDWLGGLVVAVGGRVAGG